LNVKLKLIVTLYFQFSMVSLNLRNAYLNVATLKIPILLHVKMNISMYETVFYTSSYTKLYTLKWSSFWPTLYTMSYSATTINDKNNGNYND